MYCSVFTAAPQEGLHKAGVFMHTRIRESVFFMVGRKYKSMCSKNIRQRASYTGGLEQKNER